MKFRTALLIAILAEVAVALLGIISGGWSLEGLQHTTRYSGRLSLLIFSFIFLLHPNNKTRFEPYLSSKYFLVFANAHGIHLIELIAYNISSGNMPVPYRAAGGLIAYTMIFLMPWFQEKFEHQQITSKRFQTLGYIYVFYVWLIFFMTYLGRLTGGYNNEGRQTEHVVLMVWVCVMMLIKLYIIITKKKSPKQEDFN